ncbi:uncharacterized protein (TIGR00369 family) [Bradyrhizobium sp. AZCC 1577]|uniref:PaaI family thioesterase n=1 Tax=Bradyrhizobium sp. AZCC 1577 TaxID=3117019 RepID=UPI002FF2492D
MDEGQVRELITAAIGDGRHEFGSFFLSRFFGMMVSYEDDACIASVDVKPYMFNPQGSLHGGVLATALDISMGHLLKHQFGAGATLEMKVQYFAPVRSGLVTCRATFLKKGRKTFFLQSSAMDGSGETIAHATSTWKQL